MKSIALVTCSTRAPRLNPLITSYVLSVLHTVPLPVHLTLTTIDLAAQSLPLYDEPAVPAALPAADPTPHYAHAHTRAWSTTVRAADAFVFVTPQYNWSVPAALKNALDYLFHEWGGKPAAVVSYGSRGGGKAADHLRGIIMGLRMKGVQTSVEIRAGGLDAAECAGNGEVGEEVLVRWREEGVEEQLKAMLAEIVKVLEE